MIKKVIITGATGFLGKYVLQNLIENNYLPFVMIRGDSSVYNIQEFLPFCKCINYITLKDKDLIEKLDAAKDADLFVHCAWKGVGTRDVEQLSQITYNITLTIDSVILANLINCKKWVGIGSQAEYGAVNKIAQEDETLINPFSAYGKSKAACYWASSGLCQILGIKMLWCRVFSLYGLGDNPNYFIPYVIKTCIEGNSPSLTNCEQKWDYLHVKDGAAAVCNLAEDEDGIGIFNIGSGETVILKDVVKFIKQKINRDLVIGFGEKPYSGNQIMHLEANISKLKKTITWTPKISLESGLLEVIKFYQEKHLHK